MADWPGETESPWMSPEAWLRSGRKRPGGWPPPAGWAIGSESHRKSPLWTSRQAACPVSLPSCGSVQGAGWQREVVLRRILKRTGLMSYQGPLLIASGPGNAAWAGRFRGSESGTACSRCKSQAGLRNNVRIHRCWTVARNAGPARCPVWQRRQRNVAGCFSRLLVTVPCGSWQMLQFSVTGGCS
jgi:hypothetical protein